MFSRFHMKPSVERVLTFSSNGSAQLKRMAAIPIYDKKKKTLKFFFSRTKKALKQNLDIKHWRLKVYQVSLNDDRRLTFDLFTASQICVPIHLYRKNVEKSFSQNVLD